MMSCSPERKKMELVNQDDKSNKRVIENTESVEAEPSKRQRTDGTPNEDIEAKKRRNFITACELVSYKAYFDHQSRFRAVYLPPCAEQISCRHNDFKTPTNCGKVMPLYKEESFHIEMKANMWREALEVCRLCITPDQHLPANILKDVIEIMMNAHDEDTSDCLIDKCQQVLELNFSYHPPCADTNIRKCYSEFLTSPMELRAKSFSDREKFGSEKGIVKYCFNRLEHEISLHSKDEPLFDKSQHIPEDMKQSVMGLNWQKEKFEIFELLERSERIKRLMIVLDIIIELLQCDLAIWQKRNMKRSHKPLLEYLLRPNNDLSTVTVNEDCRKILRLFVYMIHLQYPEEHIKTMIAWLNTVIQTLYICKDNSNRNYPSTGKYCYAFANALYKIIAEMPHETIIQVLERIKPDFMQSLVGSLHVKQLLKTHEENPIKVFTEFLKSSQWKNFSENTSEMKIFKKTYNVKDLVRHLKMRCSYLNAQTLDVEIDNDLYHKFDPYFIRKNSKPSLNHVVHTLYVTLEAYLDSYSIQDIQETLDDLNEKLENGEMSSDHDQQTVFLDCSYTVTEDFIQKYLHIYQLLKELMSTLQNMKSSESLPKIFTLFEKIDLLGM